MDIVDTLSHLIPSDQLDESLTIGQNLECEGSNEFGPGLRLEDSLKNMLSDKDPMFGCAGSQFNLLDNEDPAFPIAGSTGMSAVKLWGKNGQMDISQINFDQELTVTCSKQEYTIKSIQNKCWLKKKNVVRKHFLVH